MVMVPELCSSGWAGSKLRHAETTTQQLFHTSCTCCLHGLLSFYFLFKLFLFSFCAADSILFSFYFNSDLIPLVWIDEYFSQIPGTGWGAGPPAGFSSPRWRGGERNPGPFPHTGIPDAKTDLYGHSDGAFILKAEKCCWCKNEQFKKKINMKKQNKTKKREWTSEEKQKPFPLIKHRTCRSRWRCRCGGGWSELSGEVPSWQNVLAAAIKWGDQDNMQRVDDCIKPVGLKLSITQLHPHIWDCIDLVSFVLRFVGKEPLQNAVSELEECKTQESPESAFKPTIFWFLNQN